MKKVESIKRIISRVEVFWALLLLWTTANTLRGHWHITNRSPAQMKDNDALNTAVVLLDGSTLFQENELQREPVQFLRTMLVSLKARGSYRPLLLFFVTSHQAQVINSQERVGTVAVQQINVVLQETDVQIVEVAEGETWTDSAARLLESKLNTPGTLPTLGTYLLLGSPHVLIQENIDIWWESISRSRGDIQPSENRNYVLLMKCMDKCHMEDLHYIRQNILAKSCVCSDVIVATSLVSAQEITKRMSTNRLIEFEKHDDLKPELSCKLTTPCSTSTYQATSVQELSVVVQDVNSSEAIVLFVREGGRLAVNDGSILEEYREEVPWVVVGYNDNVDLRQYIANLYPWKMLTQQNVIDATATHNHSTETPHSGRNRNINGDGRYLDELQHKGHVSGISTELITLLKRNAGVDAVEMWATTAQGQVRQLPEASCPNNSVLPDYEAMSIIENPRNVTTVHLVGVEDLHKYHSISGFPKYLLPDGDDEKVCALWPESSFCNSTTMTKHTCRWKRFIQATDCAFIDDGSIHSDVPGLVYDSRHWYPDHPQNEAAPSAHISKTIHHFDELGNGLSAYGGAVAHFWIEVLPQILHMEAILPSHVRILVDDRHTQVKKIFEYMHEKKILSSNRIESWMGQGHIYAARRVYHSAEMAINPQTAIGVDILSNAKNRISAEFKYITNEFCFWKNALPLHLVHLRFQPYLRPAHHRRDIVVLHRRDARSRKVKNHDEVMKSLRAAFPNRNVVELVISDHSVGRVVQIMSKAGIFIAPHGAGLINMMFVAEGTPVIELAYTRPGRMAWPADYFYPSAINLGLKYGIVLAEGDYDTAMIVPSKKLVALAMKLLS